MTRLHTSLGRYLGFLLSLLIAGCAPFPKVDPPEPEVGVQTLASKEAFSAPSGSWPSDRWWVKYDDSQLDQLMVEALRESPSLRVAQARVRRAQAVGQIAGAPLLPQVSLEAAAGAQRLSYNYLTAPQSVARGWNDVGQVAFDMRWEIDFWGKYRAGLAAATSEIEARRAELAQAELALTTSLASSYAELARLYALKDTAERAVKVRARTQSLFAERQLHGLETKASVLEAQAKEAQAQTENLFLAEQIALEKNRLASLLGAGPDRGLQIRRPGAVLQKSLSLPKELAADLIGRRPDVIAARLQAQAQSNLVKRSEAAFYPNVNLAAIIGLQSLGLNVLGQSGSTYGRVGPAISLPIFTGGRLQGELLGARAEYDEAVAVYNNTLIHALQNVADVVTSYRALEGQLKQAERGLTAALQANQLASGRYRGGLSSYLEVLVSEDIMLTSLRVVTELRARNFMLDVALARALGGGYHSNQTEPLRLSK
jgi:NodT family efflux transporter outer membrane factor (OMF) lipoprotein